VCVTQHEPVMPWWAGYICQALSFATATAVRPVLGVREWDDRFVMEILSGPFQVRSGRLIRPINELSTEGFSDFWVLLRCLYEWAERDHVLAERLFNELDGIRNGSTGSLEAACLTLAVGIECVAQFLIEDEAVEIDTTEAGHINSLKEHVEKWDGPQSMRKRGLDLLRPLGRPRLVDRMYAFARRKHISDDLVSRWKELRDTTAHGRANGDQQRMSDLYFSATEFLYRLIADQIGYNGRITSISKRGWGLDQWGAPTGGDL
jgi:hypothetical protein